MGDVVVTALALKSERKGINMGYPVIGSNAQELMKNKNTNVVNTLAGKVPGVNCSLHPAVQLQARRVSSITIRSDNFQFG